MQICSSYLALRKHPYLAMGALSPPLAGRAARMSQGALADDARGV